MDQDFSIVKLHFQYQTEYLKWKELLACCDIERIPLGKDNQIEEAFGIYDKEQLIATIAYSGNTIQYVAIDPRYRSENGIFNSLVSHVINLLASRSIFHLFVFTKPEYKIAFISLGFCSVVEVENGVFLERGDRTLQDFISELPVSPIQGNSIAAIVMNANPFTLGHQFLIEKASKENDFVYVFVVSENGSIFSSDERKYLVTDGVAHLKNVVVCSGKEYMISYTTFPSYFLRKNDSVTYFQAQLDCTLFLKIANTLGITKRYVGTEPFSPMTETYNQVMKQVFKDQITLEIIPRKLGENEEMISASHVRKLIEEDKLNEVKLIVPSVTYNFIEKNKTELQERIRRKETNGD